MVLEENSDITLSLKLMNLIIDLGDLLGLYKHIVIWMLLVSKSYCEYVFEYIALIWKLNEKERLKSRTDYSIV